MADKDAYSPSKSRRGYSNDEKVTLRFADEIMYRVAFEHATSLLKSGKSPNDLLPVFGRSAEYAVINRLLEKGGSLDGIRMVEPVLFGYED